MDLTTTLASQDARVFGVVLKDIQTHNKKFIDKLASMEDEMKKIKVEVEELRAQQVEEVTKLESVLAEIEALKMEVHESQWKVASLNKKVETSNNHQKLKAKALDEANLKLPGLKDVNQLYVLYYIHL